MKLRLTPRAIKDLARIADYFRVRNPAAAGHVRASILDSMQTLVRFPRAGRNQNVEGVRKFVTRKNSYLVYYIVDESAEEIVILTIQHSARERAYGDK
jgi:addiction module RelE/StbE family toxin